MSPYPCCWAVSIHAPARGATCHPVTASWWSTCFNSRARKGRDTDDGGHFVGGRVSIHAPARGATFFRVCLFCHSLGFNSRARKGRDNMDARRFHPRKFQFTRPQGARRLPCAHRRFRLSFQFTRPQGARLAQGDEPIIGTGFQFTRPQGARRCEHRIADNRSVSIHAPARGATFSFSFWFSFSLFQFTRPQGARPPRLPVIAHTCEVSIHAPARGATLVNL